MDVHQTTINHQELRNSADKDKLYDSRLAANYRPLLTKNDSIDLDCKLRPTLMWTLNDSKILADKKLGRGISRANDENVSLVTKARKEFAMDFHAKQEQTSPFIDTPDYTFTLPDLSVHDEDFRLVFFRLFSIFVCSNFLSSSPNLVEGFWRKIWLRRRRWTVWRTAKG